MNDPNSAIADQLRAKIIGKVQSATFLAGFTITLIGVEITVLWTEHAPVTISIAIAVLGFALVLFIRAIFHLDTLTMPKRFWKEEDNNKTTKTAGYWADISSNDLWGIQKRMVFIWTRLVQVGLGASVLSLWLMTCPAILGPVLPNSGSLPNASWVSFVLLFFGAIAAMLYSIIFANEEKQKDLPKLEREPRD